MLQFLTTFGYALLMILGFGFIIVVHELGHFLAAKWAGVRVHAFAVGFGQALSSYRKGLGFRWGSSEQEYNRIISTQSSDSTAALSPTEYRLNWFPFGGYVRMLGQEDLSPITAATSSDSYTAKPVWKRMIIISGGVVMNLILAAILFVISYQVGIQEVRPLAGEITPNSPAAAAGFQPGDKFLSINNKPVNTFNDLMIGVAMARGETPLPIDIDRNGERLTLTPTPVKGSIGLLQIGISPAPARSIVHERELNTPELRATITRAKEQLGLGEIPFGAELISINNTPLNDQPTALPLRRAIESSQGNPLSLTFRAPDNRTISATITPAPLIQTSEAKVRGERFALRHIFGLAPVMTVEAAEPRAAAAGLKPGDVFERIGTVEWPSIALGIAEVRANKGKSIPLVIHRNGERLELTAEVDRDGRIGFLVSDVAASDTLLASIPADITGAPLATQRLLPAIIPGSRITHAAGTPIASFTDLLTILREKTAPALDSNSAAAIPLTLILPTNSANPTPSTETITLSLTEQEVKDLHSLGYNADAFLALFDTAQFMDRATSSINAIAKGIHKTHEVILMTYLTLARLVQGSVPVDQLHGPVGITHVGTRVAERGLIYIIFFLGLISANLAVVNFLPIPIVDGGHMVFLFIEAITRKPVSIAIQNIATIIGLCLIGTMFLVVTFNDVIRLFS